MDQETEAPLDDVESMRDDDADEELVARSSANGSVVTGTGG